MGQYGSVSLNVSRGSTYSSWIVVTSARLTMPLLSLSAKPSPVMKLISRTGRPNLFSVKAGLRCSANVTAFDRKSSSSPGSHSCDVFRDKALS